MMQRSNDGGTPLFRPNLRACVGEDVRLARAVEESYLEKLASVAAYTYRSLMTEEIDCALAEVFDSYAVEEMEHFRLLGDLILSLGGDPALRTQVRVTPIDWRRERRKEQDRTVIQLLEEAIREEKRSVERLEVLMGHTEDRVVRSLLAYLISDGQRHVSCLQDALA